MKLCEKAKKVSLHPSQRRCQRPVVDREPDDFSIPVGLLPIELSSNRVHWFSRSSRTAAATLLALEDRNREDEFYLFIPAMKAAWEANDSESCVKPFDFPATDPSEVRVHGTAATSFRLSWQDNATNEKRYEIWIMRAGGEFQLAKKVRANGTTALIKAESLRGPALEPNTEYTVKVRAVNHAGVPSGFSRAVTLRTLARSENVGRNEFCALC